MIDWESILPVAHTVTIAFNSSVLSISLPYSGSSFNLATLAAILALILGIYNAYVHWIENQPSLKVENLPGLLGSSTTDMLAIFVDGYNHSQVPINITNLMFHFPKYHLIIVLHCQKKKVLPGAAYRRWEYSDVIAECLKENLSEFYHQDAPKNVKIEAWIEDEMGHIYKSKSSDFNVEFATTGSVITESNRDDIIRSAISHCYLDPFSKYNPWNIRRTLWFYRSRLWEFLGRI